MKPLNKSLRVCFFAGVKDKDLLDLMQWYKEDIQILKELGFEVAIATNWREIPWNAALYFAWWPTKGILPLIKAKIMRKPIIIVAGGSEVVRQRDLKYGFSNSSIIKRAIIIFCLKHTDRILSISDAATKEILALVPNCKVETVYLSVDTATFTPNDNDKKNIIFTISHLNRENIHRKRIKEIIKAIPYVVKDFPEVKFVIAGRKLEGFEELEYEVERLSIQKFVSFPGKISNDEKVEYFRKSLIYLQPTLHEGFGLAIAEAMSCGVPVITTKVGAVPEVVDEAGIYVNPNEPLEIANAIKELLSNSDLRI